MSGFTTARLRHYRKAMGPQFKCKDKKRSKIQCKVLCITGTTTVIQLLYETHSLHCCRKIEGYSKTAEEANKNYIQIRVKILNNNNKILTNSTIVIIKLTGDAQKIRVKM
jgi:hypothetical protein